MPEPEGPRSTVRPPGGGAKCGNVEDRKCSPAGVAEREPQRLGDEHLGPVELGRFQPDQADEAGVGVRLEAEVEPAVDADADIVGTWR